MVYYFRVFYFCLGAQLLFFQNCVYGKSDFSLAMCAATKCTGQFFNCMKDKNCRDTLNCNRKCGSSGTKADQQACHLVCQLDKGLGNKHYQSFIGCGVKNDCIPKLPEGVDGTCPVNESNMDQVYQLSSIKELEGTWLEVRGRNCGVKGSKWEGGYDALPCRNSSWVFSDQDWWYHTSFCSPGSGGNCKGKKPVHLIASPSINPNNPALLDVDYTNPPLKPQEEEWYVISKPHPDWLMYAYCGENPAAKYAGVNIITRTPKPWETGIPAEVESELKKSAEKFGIEYDQMCSGDHRNCPKFDAQKDVETWIDENK